MTDTPDDEIDLDNIVSLFKQQPEATEDDLPPTNSNAPIRSYKVIFRDGNVETYVGFMYLTPEFATFMRPDDETGEQSIDVLIPYDQVKAIIKVHS